MRVEGLVIAPVIYTIEEAVALVDKPACCDDERDWLRAAIADACPRMGSAVPARPWRALSPVGPAPARERASCGSWPPVRPPKEEGGRKPPLRSRPGGLQRPPTLWRLQQRWTRTFP